MKAKARGRDKRRANWMSEFQDRIIAARPEAQGKLDWDTATFLFNEGHSVTEAAERYLGSRYLGRDIHGCDTSDPAAVVSTAELRAACERQLYAWPKFGQDWR